MMADLRLKTPFSMIISSPSNSGKSTWIGKLLSQANIYFDKPPSRVVYFYNIWSKTFDQWLEDGTISEFVKGMCTREWLEENCFKEDNMTVVLDDQAAKITADIAEVFSVFSHNFNVNFIMLAQNIFTKNKYFRDASLNSSYIVLGKNPRDQTSIRYLSQQMMPKRSKELVDAYFLATQKPFSFLLLNFTQTCPEHCRIIGNYLQENDMPMSAYIKRE